MQKIYSPLFAILIFASTTQANPPVEGGVSGSGGGDAFSSTPAEVDAYVSKMKHDILIRLVSEAETRQFLNPKYVTDPDLKKLMESFSRVKDGKKLSGVEFTAEAMATEYVSKDSCKNQFGGSDAGTKLQRSAEICFDRQRLARFSKEELEIEIPNLAMHELAHHFGASQSVAVKFQKHMKGFVRNFTEQSRQARALSYDRNSSRPVFELRPGGSISFKASCGSTKVKCLDENNPGNSSSANENTTFILSGQTTLIKSSEGTKSVSCKRYPPVDCRIEMVKGKRQIFLDNYPYWYEGNADEDLSNLRRAGVCARELAKNMDSVGKIPNSSAN